MADKSFGIRELNLIGSSGTPTIESPNDINLNASTVAISTNLTVGNKVSVLSTGIVTSVSGVVTFYGDGAYLAGIDHTAIKDSDGNIKVQANGSGTVVTGILTANVEARQLDVTGVSTFAEFAEFSASVGIGTTNTSSVDSTNTKVLAVGIVTSHDSFNTNIVTDKIKLGHHNDIELHDGNPALQVVGVTSATSTLAIYRYEGNDQSATLNFVKSRNTSPGNNSFVQPGDELGKIIFNGDDASDINNAGAEIKAVVGTSAGSDTSDMPGSLVFLTSPDDENTPKEALRIDYEQNIGIGTAVPKDAATNQGALLSVAGIVTAHKLYVGGLEVTGDGGGGGSLDEIVEDTTPQLGGDLDGNSKSIDGIINLKATGIITATTFKGDGSELTGITGGHWAKTDVGINTSDKVGIGTTNPVANLDISGKLLVGDSISHTNLSNVLDVSATTGVTGFRSINLIDTSSVIKFARNHNDYGPALDMQHWNSDISTMYGRGLAGISSLGMYLNNTTEGGYIHFDTKASGESSTEKVRITSGGDVGIGTTGRTFGGDTPHTPALLISGNDYNKATLGLINIADDNNGSYIFLGKQRGNNIGIATLQDGDNIGQLRFIAADGNDLNSSAAAIESQVDGIVGVNSTPGRIKFLTTPSGSNSPTERLRITSAGNVGIGTNDPDSYDGWGKNLVVGNSSDHSGITIVSSNTAGKLGHLLFADGTGGTPDQEGRIGYEHNNNYMYFATNNVEALRITSDGKIGIGTTTPQGDLQVGTGITMYGNTGIISATKFIVGGQTGFLKADGSINDGTFADGAIASLADDTTPQLGADLDGNSKNIHSVGIITATTLSGTVESVWTVTSTGTGHWAFNGGNFSPGMEGNADHDPTLQLIRGQKYRFKNAAGGTHEFRIQSTPNGSVGTQYNDGVTNNDGGDGIDIEFYVPFDAPAVLYYQCTQHNDMGGVMYITGSGDDPAYFGVDVGIGTTNPTKDFEVYRNGLANAKIRGDVAGGLGAELILQNANTAANGYSEIQFQDAGTNVFSKIRGFNLTDGSNDGYMALYTSSATEGIKERVRISDAGNVGIGTNAPYLNASYNSLSIGGLEKGLIELNDGSDVARAHLYTDGGDFKVSTVGTAGTITFITGGTPTERFNITSAGDVGIGTDNPVGAAATTNNTKVLAVGIVTAQTYYGDGSNLTGVSGGSETVESTGDFVGLIKEEVRIDAARLDEDENINLEDGMVHYFQDPENSTSTPNIRYNGSTTLTSKMTVNQVITVTIITRSDGDSGSAYSANIKIDDDAVTEKWLCATAPSSPAATSGYNVYTHTIIKKGSSGTTADDFLVLSTVANYDS